MTNKITVYVRKDNRYESRLIIGKDEKGKSIYKSFYGKTPEDVLKKREIFVSALNSAVDNHSGTGMTMRFSKLAEEWLTIKELEIKASTAGNYRTKLDTHILPYFGDMDVSEITPADVNGFISAKSGGKCSVRYICDILIVLKAIFKYGAKVYGIHNVFDHVNMPKHQKKGVPLLPEDEVKRLIKVLSQSPDRKALGVLMAIYLGLRIGEICGLKWSDIDLVNGMVHIRRTVQRVKSKNGKTKTEIIIGEPKSEKSRRSVPVCRELLEILNSFKSDDNNYIISGTNRPTEPRGLQYYFKQFLINGNFSSVTFHSLRHSFATKAIASGCDMKTLSELMGHSSVDVTMGIYVYSDIDRKRTCIDNMRWSA